MIRNRVYITVMLILFSAEIILSDVPASELSYPKDFRFENLIQVIPSSVTYCIYQDSIGFLWFGSAGDGLIRHDGLNSIVYDEVKGQIRDIVEYHSGEGTLLWIATYGNGLWKYNPEKEVFYNYLNDPSDSTSLSCNRIQHLFLNDDGALWISTMRGGLNILRAEQMEAEKPQFIKVRYDPSDSTGLNSEEIGPIYKDKRDSIWVCTSMGLSKMVSGYQTGQPFKFRNYWPYNDDVPINRTFIDIDDIIEDSHHYLWLSIAGQGIFRSIYPINAVKELRFKHYVPNPTDRTSIKGATFREIIEDQRGRILMPGYDAGESIVNVYNRTTDSFAHFSMDETNPESFPLLSCYCLLEDKSGNIWFGGFPGVAKLSPQKQNFNSIIQKPGNAQSLLYKNTLAVCEDLSGNVWIGNSSVLTKLDLKMNMYTHYRHDPANPASLGKNTYIQKLFFNPTDKNYLLLGLNGGYLQKLDIENGNFTHYKTPGVYDFCPSIHGFYWLASYAGVIKFYPQSGKLEYSVAENSTTHCLYEDSRGYLWVGTFSDGVLKYDYEKDQQVWYKHDPDDKKSLSLNKIEVIYEDRNGIIWIGSAGGGLNKYDAESNSFITYRVADGLAHNYVSSILEDDPGFLWIGTNNGLSKFNPVDGSFNNYYKTDGLPGNIFIDRACYKSPLTGYFFFGTSEGCTFFHPESIKSNPHKPTVSITDFQLFNKSVIPGPESPLKKNITFSKEITLSSDQNVFSFEFAALEYTNPENNRYAYMMEGVDHDWVFVGASRRYTTYTQLDPGTYTFRVKASNNDGVWNEEGTSVNVIILPPWWKTKRAYMFYFLFFISIVYGLWRFQLKRIRLNHKLEMEQLNAEKLREIDQVKTRFFANISHEFRTPLTLILAPVNQLITDTYHGSVKEGYHLIRSNARKLLQLVNQLLALSKLEAGQLNLQVARQDIVPFLNRIYNSFLSLAESKNIEFDFTPSMESVLIYFDEEKLETVMNNLLSNAFKFTPEGGEVQIELGTAANIHPPNSPLDRGEMNYSPLEKGDKGGCLQISVSNTGPGIPPDQLEKIFGRFYQADAGNRYYGTGIGLSLAKDLIELHHGQIHAESALNERTIFTIALSLSKDAYYTGEIIEKIPGPAEDDISDSITHEFEDASAYGDTAGLPTVLLVEDNREMREYLHAHLQSKFNIVEATDGKDALRITSQKLPDLIISDVMMPEMDGFELCEHIKQDPQTGHIPVILLTARATREDKLEGLKTGADDYLPKPFDLEELLVRASNLIEQRQKLRERFKREALFGLNELSTTPIDQNFVEKIQAVIERHLDNPEYSIDDFARDLALSRTQLFRKLKSWTSLTPHQFIRLCRLKKAALILQQHSGNVTSVAYDVGFNNVSHFIHLFKEHFGKTPAEFSSHNHTDA